MTEGTKAVSFMQQTGILHLRHTTHLEKSLDILGLCVLLALALVLLPSVPFGLAGQVEHAGSGGVDIADGGLLVEAVEGQLLGLGWLDGSVLWERLDGGHSLVELSSGRHFDYVRLEMCESVKLVVIECLSRKGEM